VFDVKEGKETRQLAGHRMGTNRIAFSPDARTLWTSGNDYTLRRWDLTTGKEMGPPMGHQNSVNGVTFTADGKQIISCSRDGSVRFWNVDTGRELRRLTAEDACFQALAKSPGGKLLALSSNSALRWRMRVRGDEDVSYLHLWDLAENKQRDCFCLPGESAQEMQFTPDGRELLFVNRNHVRFREVKTGKDRLTVAHTGRDLDAAILSPDGKYVVTSSYGQALHQADRITYWEADKGKKVMACSLMSGRFSSLAYSPDGRFLAVADNGGPREDGNLYLWESLTDKVVRTFATTRFDHYKLAYSPDGRLLAAADPDGLSIFETATGQQRWRFTGGHTELIASMAFSPDSRRLVTGGDDTLIYLWDLTGLHGRGQPAPLEARDLDAAWAVLTDLDGEPAGKAIARLAASPREAIPYLTEKLGTVSDEERRRIEGLIRDLDSDSFKVRDRAAKELENFGDPAVPALTRAQTTSKSAEVRTKSEQLLKKIGPGDDPATHALARRAVRAIEVLEHAATPEALEVLKSLQERGRSRLEHDEADKALRRLNKRNAP
jgi:WD40 repeat protein